VIFLGLALVLLLPSLRETSTTILGGRDAHETLWIFESNIRDFFSLPWFSTRGSYPWIGTLAWGDNFLLPSLWGAPLVALGASVPLAFNLILLLAFALNGYCTFRLIYQLTGSSPASLLGGVAFLLLPTLNAPGVNIPLKFSFILPLVVSFSLSIVSRGGIRTGLWLGCSLAAAFLTSIDLWIVGALSAIIVISGAATLHPSRGAGRPLRRTLGGVVLGLIPLIPILDSYVEASRHLTPKFMVVGLGAAEAPFSGIAPRSILAGDCAGTSAIDNAFSLGLLVSLGAIGALLRLTDTRRLLVPLGTAIGSLVGAGLFHLGSAVPAAHLARIALCLLTLSALYSLLFRLGSLERKLNVAIITNRDLIALFFALAGFFLLYGFGSVGGMSPSDSPSSLFSLIAVTLKPFPIAAPAAGSLMVGLAGIVLAAFTLTRTLRRAEVRTILPPFLFLALAFELYPVCGVPVTPLTPRRTTDSFIEGLEKNGDVFVVLPFQRGTEQNRRFGELLAHSDVPFMNGPASERSPFFERFRREVADFPSAQALRALTAIVGLRFVVVDEPLLPNPAKESLLQRVDRFGADLKYLERDGEGRHLFELIAETRLKDDTVLLAPARPEGVLRVELKALYEPETPHIPIALRWQNGDAPVLLSEVVVTANGEWSAFSFPLPRGLHTTQPIALSFSVPPGARIWFRRTGFAPYR
jgi:hypothetical protein